MVKGIHLTLLIGPVVPVPAPQFVVEALTAVQVNSGGTRSGFQLTFNVGKTSPLITTMLPAGYLDPMLTRVILVVTVNGIPHVISDGMVTRQEVSPSNEPGGTMITVTGEDLSVLMDIVELPFMRYPAMPDNVQVSLALSKYMAFGIVPLVIPPIFPNFPNPLERIPGQQGGTDRAHIRNLAQKNGYVFYVEPGPVPGANIAYWGPDVRLPVPQPALSVNMDAHSNVDSIRFSLDGLKKKITVLTVLDPVTKRIPIPVPVPDVNILHPPLGARPTLPFRVTFPEGMARLSVAEAIGAALGISVNSADAVSGSGALDVVRYGHVLKARMLVGVRGAGLAYDGLYYVNSVTHDIKPGQYKQSFSISRDGLVSITPGVAP